MPLFPGEPLKQRYRIVSLLAQGMYGATYRAWDRTAAQDVVIKEHLDSAVATQRRFRAEARRLGDLSHPQLAAVLDHFALEGRGQYLVSAYVDGVSLRELLDQYGPLPGEQVAAWLQAAGQPLAYLHEQGQLHLNIKPANLRLTPSGDLVLVDTGLPGLGIRPHVGGYGAPEQQIQEEVGPRSDIYSLGATLYTLLTGTEPPPALSRESGLADLKPAREVNSEVAPYLSVVAARAMSLRDDARYDTAVAFAQALSPPVGQPTAATGTRRTPQQMPTDAPPPRLPAKRRKQMEQRTIYGLVGALLLIIVLMVGFGFVEWERPSDEIAEAEATATFVSAVIAAATDLAPTSTPIPPPTEAPTPTPEPFVSKTGARMVYMPTGRFRMGNDEGERDEEPSHMVQLDAFYIDETEVTNAAYAECVEDGACEPPDSPYATYHDRYYDAPNFANYPVLFVSWYDADTYCRWREARLPTEAEWEKAAGFDPEQALKLTYPWGEAFDGARLNFCDANCPRQDRDPDYDDGHRDTALVGSYPDGRSPIGAYDMSGNVMEWVADWYDSRYYEESTDTNPLGPLEGEIKAIRGGSWLSDAAEVTVSARTAFEPSVSRANLGFRCAMDVQ